MMFEETTGNPANRRDDSAEKDRRGRRRNLACRLFFFGDDDFEGEGSVLDVSTTGCRASSSINLEPGKLLKLSLFRPDHPWPLQVEQAVVRWVKGQELRGIYEYSPRATGTASRPLDEGDALTPFLSPQMVSEHPAGVTPDRGRTSFVLAFYSSVWPSFRVLGQLSWTGHYVRSGLTSVTLVTLGNRWVEVDLGAFQPRFLCFVARLSIPRRWPPPLPKYFVWVYREPADQVHWT
jgi:hypothetical protein